MAIFAPGKRLTAALLNSVVGIEAVKPGNTARPSQVTLAADPDLAITIPLANAAYEVEAVLFASSAANAAGDIQYQFTYPAGASLSLQTLGPHNSLASGSQADGEWFFVALDSASPSTAVPVGASVAGAGAVLKGRLTVGATTGSLVLWWAQQTSNASATTLLAGSYLRIRRVG